VPPQVQVWPIHDCPEHLQALLPAWRTACFPPRPVAITWRPGDYIQWVFAAGEPVSVLTIIDHTVRVGGEAVHVGGIAGVMTPPPQQGRGYASASLRHAAEFLRDTLGVPFGLLGCEPHNVPFYARLGWEPLAAEFTFEQPDGRAGLRFSWRDVALILPLAGIPWPDGDLIDFNGLPW
jgi:GNAT superfamily N-acetyltransferase